jgi:hypothetical protein
MSERTIRTAFLALAVVHLGLGAWLFFFPHSFYESVGAFSAYNRHYERDTATFYFAFGFGAWVAAARRSWRVPVLAMTLVQYTIHTINHAIDAGDANNSWAGPVDAVALGLGAVQFAALLWLLGKRAEPA